MNIYPEFVDFLARYQVPLRNVYAVSFVRGTCRRIPKHAIWCSGVSNRTSLPDTDRIASASQLWCRSVQNRIDPRTASLAKLCLGILHIQSSSTPLSVFFDLLDLNLVVSRLAGV